MIVWMEESWATYRAGCDDLWNQHYLEIAVDKRMPMAPDEAAYRALDAAGQLHVLVGRERGVMVGYFLTVIRRHLHYATLCAFEDAYYLSPSRRRGMAGVRMIRTWRDSMRARGVQKAFIMTKPFLDMGPLFDRLGAVLTDKVYAFTFSETV